MIQESSRWVTRAVVVLLALAVLPSARLTAAVSPASPAALTCAPLAPPTTSPPITATPPAAPPAPAGATKITLGYVPVSIYAPLFVAQAKGYYAEQGLDVSLKPLPGGADLITLTATNQFNIAAAGAGPAFWNAVANGFPLRVIAPGHAEGSPVATPLMISTKDCASGRIKTVADLKGKKVSVNARGATEYWLSQALATAGLTINDITLQTLAFPDAVTALSSGAIDAAMVGEPLATLAEQQGIAVRLLADFPVQDIQPTVIVGNSDWLAGHQQAAIGFVTAYLKACRDLTGAGFTDPVNLAIIEQYTKVPAALVQQAVAPIFAVDGAVNLPGLAKLQTFFRQRGQLEYDQDLDPASFVDTTYVAAALAVLGPYQAK